MLQSASVVCWAPLKIIDKNPMPNTKPNSTFSNQRFCSHKMAVLSVLISLTVSGCSSLGSESAADADEVYTGWYCEGQINSDDNWHCSKGPLKAGVPIPTPERQTTGNNAPEPSPSQQVESENVAVAVDNNMVQEASVAGPIEELIEEPAIFDISGSGYTVQLGAYLSQAMAEQAADKIILDQGELRVRDIVVGNRQMFVVVFGQYPNRKQATAAAQQLNELNPALSYWVRTIPSMRARN